MARYYFRDGKVTVDEELYTPVIRESKEASRGVLIFAKQLLQRESGESTQDKGCSNVQQRS